MSGFVCVMLTLVFGYKEVGAILRCFFRSLSSPHGHILNSIIHTCNFLTMSSMNDKDGAVPSIEASRSQVSSDVEDGQTASLRSAHSKVDKRLLLWYSIVYLIMRVHVGNISNAAIINLEQGDGIKKQLGNLSSSQWAWALSIFYYPYMVFEPLATLALKRFSPSLWMARIMLTWVCCAIHPTPASLYV
jgi:hypothetical protein